MRTFSTCRGCGEILMTAIGTRTVNTNVHDGRCTNARPTRREVLSDQLNILTADDNPEDFDRVARELADLDNQPPRLLESAMRYAEWGWPVFPLGRMSKKPAISKHDGGNGVLDATTDVDRIKRYWQKHPDHNIGIATGFAFDVLDVDTPKEPGDPDGRDMLPKILESDKIPDAHGVVITASGGLHYYLEPAGIGNRAGIVPGIDIRGKGGYVVAPPSRLMTGRWFWSIAVSPTLIKQP